MTNNKADRKKIRTPRRSGEKRKNFVLINSTYGKDNQK